MIGCQIDQTDLELFSVMKQTDTQQEQISKHEDLTAKSIRRTGRQEAFPPTTPLVLELELLEFHSIH